MLIRVVPLGYNMTNATTTQEFELGCYFDGAFGFEHNLRRIIAFAENKGFRTDLSLELGEDMDFDVGVLDEAENFLNEWCRDDESSAWGWIHGDFGLWTLEDYEMS